MAKYVYKKNVVDAVQYRDDGSANAEIIELLGEANALQNIAKPNKQLIVRTAQKGFSTVRDGEWVMLYSWGDIGIMNEATFEAYYMPKP
jgi:hypothetical protein